MSFILWPWCLTFSSVSNIFFGQLHHTKACGTHLSIFSCPKSFFLQPVWFHFFAHFYSEGTHGGEYFSGKSLLFPPSIAQLLSTLCNTVQHCATLVNTVDFGSSFTFPHKQLRAAAAHNFTSWAGEEEKCSYIGFCKKPASCFTQAVCRLNVLKCLQKKHFHIWCFAHKKVRGAPLIMIINDPCSNRHCPNSFSTPLHPLR